MPDPEEKHQRRGAHWTFNAIKFIQDLRAARESGQGSFPSFDHKQGDPQENAIQVPGEGGEKRCRLCSLILTCFYCWCGLFPMMNRSTAVHHRWC